METADQVAQLTCLAVVSPGTLAREVAPVLEVLTAAVTSDIRIVSLPVLGVADRHADQLAQQGLGLSVANTCNSASEVEPTHEACLRSLQVLETRLPFGYVAAPALCVPASQALLDNWLQSSHVTSGLRVRVH